MRIWTRRRAVGAAGWRTVSLGCFGEHATPRTAQHCWTPKKRPVPRSLRSEIATQRTSVRADLGQQRRSIYDVRRILGLAFAVAKYACPGWAHCGLRLNPA